MKFSKKWLYIGSIFIYVKNMLSLYENPNVRIHIYQTNQFRFKKKSGRLFVEIAGCILTKVH